MRGQSDGGAMRLVGALAIVVVVVGGASGLGIAFYTFFERDTAAPPQVAVPDDVIATTVPPTLPSTGVATKPARSASETTITTVAAGEPLATLFVRGPTSVLPGETARYCLRGAPTPIANAEVMLDGVSVGALDAEGCVSVQVADGTHELFAAAAGVHGGTATALVVITATEQEGAA